MVLNAAVIGTGEDPEQRDRTGYAMAYRHAPGYERRDDVDLVACADIVPENALAFANRFDVPKANVYEDYETMLEELDIDVVSVCTPPAVHADIVVGCAESGTPDAVHCEKPMATTWGDCQRMVDACDRNDVQFTINHQRRFGGPFLKAKALLDRGEIGDLERLEWGEVNLLDAGVHLFDLCGFYTDGTPVKWVLANVDYREENLWFGTHNENQGLAQWQYEDGVTGLALTGEADGLGADVVGCYLRLVGSDGVIELGVEDGPALRYRTSDSAWKTVDTAETIYGPKTGLARAGVQKLLEQVPVVDESRLDKPSFHERSIDEVIESLLDGREPSIRGAVSLRATELAFASWESARRQGRVDLPLDIDDNPLEAMVESGVYDVGAAAEDE